MGVNCRLFVVLSGVVAACADSSGPGRHGLYVGDTRYKQPPSPAGGTGVTRRAGGGGSSRRVFLNFEGGTLNCSDYDNAITNDSWIACEWGAGEYPAFSSSGYGCSSREACIDSIADRVRDLWADYDITFTTERPTSGSYEVVMIGGSAGGGAAGLAPLDCNDYFPSNISFAFSEVLAGYGDCSQGMLTTAISQELGHALGLCHNNQCDAYPGTPSVMCPYTAECDAGWSCGANVDSCPCEGEGYDPYCPTDYLADLLGPSAPDTISPTVSIESPQQGQTVPRDFTLRVDASDDRDVARVEVFVDDAAEPGATITQPPYEIDAHDQPLGMHTYRVVVWDEAGHSAEDSVTVTVSEEVECTPGICCCGPNCCEEQCDCSDLSPTGSACSDDSECQGKSCIANARQPDLGRMCSQSCGDESDCPTGYECIDAGSQTLCWPSVGKSCSGPADCPAGACLGGASGNYCTVDCSDDSGCPNSYQCASVDERTVCVEGSGLDDAVSGCGCALMGSSTDNSPAALIWLVVGFASLAKRSFGKRKRSRARIE